VLTPEQAVVEGKRPAGRRIVVYDADGYFMGPGVAELLAREGLEIELATPFDVVAPFAAETLEDVLTRERLHEAGVRMRRNVTLTGIEPGRLSGEDEFGEPVELDADGVVLVTQRLSRDGLFHALAGEREGVYRIGDCVAPRLIAEAVFDGHRLAREIDSSQPEVALPYLRERPFMEQPVAADYGPPAPLPPRDQPAGRAPATLDGDAAGRIRELIERASGDVVVCAGAGAGDDLAPFRELAARSGGRFAVTRPQVEAGRAPRTELVGASSQTVAPALYLAFGVSGALPHLLGMLGSEIVVAVNTDPDARIFDHADYAAVADAPALVQALLAT
jgi:hypothetical protein